MKKKIGVFATGWGAEILYKYVKGAFKRAQEDGIDIYCYLNYALLNDPEETKKAELNIFELGKQEQLDGVLLFGNGLDFPGVFEGLAEHFSKRGIPIASCGKRSENTYFVGSENFSGTKQMCDHLIEKHGAKNIFFVAGSKENEDSNVRLKAISESMKEHGLELTEENIMYTNWNTSPIEDYIINTVKEGRELPDTICCANDSLAMSACIACQKVGIDVPGRVKVTGFDYEYISQIFSPSVSSVDQKFDDIGYASVDVLFDLMNGKKRDRETLIPCQFRPSESCGCSASGDAERTRKQLGATKYLNERTETAFDRKILRIERNIMLSREPDDLSRCFDNMYTIDDVFEGKTFFILIEPTYYKTMANRELKHRKEGYSKDLEVVYGVCDGKKVGHGTYSVQEVVKIAEREQSRFFLFLPLHESENNYGTILFCDDFEKLFEQSKMFRYVERMGMVLSKFHGNISLEILNRRLLEMTETDALTHVKNRTAYEAAEARINSTLTNRNFEFGVVICDVNNLKKINDKLGHEAGDEYIINCCQMVCRHFKKSRVYRIGGDEFAVILENDDYKNRIEILEHFKKEMEDLKQSERRETEKVSVACGLSVFRQGVDDKMVDVFNRADARMYANKAEMKMQRVD